ncbi:hypothetical protein P8452_64077 [Trifolium repens]|nr:hypothetical protein P8452_64077 [Trifolium repens]
MFTQNKAPDDKTTALMTNKIEITTSMKNKGHVCNIGWDACFGNNLSKSKLGCFNIVARIRRRGMHITLM